jgi:hypothetical protein
VTMGMMKNYLLNLLAQCSEENFGQDAIEWAILSGLVHLTYDLDRDLHQIMPRYDEIIEAYRASSASSLYQRQNQPAPMKRAVPDRRHANSSAAHQPARKKRAA